MRVALVIPADTPPTGGNSISAWRMQQGLIEAGHKADLVLYRAGLTGYDIYHAWNATRVGSSLVRDGINPEQVVATWTGTDLWQDWVNNPSQKKGELDSIRYHVTFTEDGRSRLLEDAPDWADRVVVIPPSVDVEHFEPEGAKADIRHPMVLLAGGVRPVKRSAWAIDLVKAAREALRQDYQLAIAGPVRETGEWDRVQAKAEGHPWVHLLQNRSREEMPRWYRAADVFLNTSEVEGVSNAIMEAMSCGALVLVTDIKGNRALVSPGRTGLVFSDEVDFVAQIERIAQEPETMDNIREAGRHQIVARHSVNHETGQYAALYEDCLSIRGCSC